MPRENEAFYLLIVLKRDLRTHGNNTEKLQNTKNTTKYGDTFRISKSDNMI